MSEYDYSCTPMAEALGLAPGDARLFMVVDRRWKLIHAEGSLPPMLFDLENDPDELVDLGRDPGHSGMVRDMRDKLGNWARRESQRTTVSDAQILARRAGAGGRTGVLIGAYDEDDVTAQDLEPYTGRITRTMQKTSDER